MLPEGNVSKTKHKTKIFAHALGLQILTTMRLDYLSYGSTNR